MVAVRHTMFRLVRPSAHKQGGRRHTYLGLPSPTTLTSSGDSLALRFVRSWRCHFDIAGLVPLIHVLLVPPCTWHQLYHNSFFEKSVTIKQRKPEWLCM